jgi:hypothetical protein
VFRPPLMTGTMWSIVRRFRVPQCWQRKSSRSQTSQRRVVLIGSLIQRPWRIWWTRVLLNPAANAIARMLYPSACAARIVSSRFAAAATALAAARDTAASVTAISYSRLTGPRVSLAEWPPLEKRSRLAACHMYRILDGLGHPVKETGHS